MTLVFSVVIIIQRPFQIKSPSDHSPSEMVIVYLFCYINHNGHQTKLSAIALELLIDFFVLLSLESMDLSNSILSTVKFH